MTPNELVEMLKALEPEERAATLNALVQEVCPDHQLSAKDDLAKLTSALRKERNERKAINRERARLQEELTAYSDENGNLIDLKGLLQREKAVTAREVAMAGVENDLSALQGAQEGALKRARVALELAVLGVDPGACDERLLALAETALENRGDRTPEEILSSDSLLAQLLPARKPSGAPMTMAGSLYQPEVPLIEAMQGMDAQAQFIAAFAQP